jgi:predicted CoA-substrate-specific enzyme activase
LYLGIDVGSVSTDAVLIDDSCHVLGYSIVSSGFDHRAAVSGAVDGIYRKTCRERNDIKMIVGTGYGRRNVPGAYKTVTEISCHAMGIHLIFPFVRTVIDIGGQDSKVIHISEDGFAESFVMNDKCAAGTGRFLEVMAHAMGIGVYELGALSLKAKKPQPISSICTVFAESEVISKIAEGCPVEEIVAGIHRAIGERIMGMVASMGVRRPVSLSGGVAKNAGVIKAIAGYLGDDLFIPEEPQIVGALGAALYARNYDRCGPCPAT